MIPATTAGPANELPLRIVFIRLLLVVIYLLRLRRTGLAIDLLLPLRTVGVFVDSLFGGFLRRRLLICRRFFFGLSLRILRFPLDLLSGCFHFPNRIEFFFRLRYESVRV